MASMLNLRASLLVLLLANSAWSKQVPWPHDLPQETTYSTEDDPLVKRGLDTLQRLKTEKPIGLKKMSTDPDQMFFLDYWIFEDTAPNKLESRSDGFLDGNDSWTPSPAIRPHLLEHEDLKLRRDLTDYLGYDSPLLKRFMCLDTYHNCSSVGQPNLCCAANASCFKNGAGTVGCCPPGATCGADTNIGACQADYTPCPNTSNGGCCIPNFSCFQQGCKCSARFLTMSAHRL
jgi:progranulin